MEHRRIPAILPLSALLIFFCLIGDGRSQQNAATPGKPQVQEPGAVPQSLAPVRRSRAALAGLEVMADLSVSPPEHSGPCPALFTFSGKIAVNRPITIYYRFVRSDNSRSQPVALSFEKAGTQEVTDTWRFDNTVGSPAFEGWQAIQILSPVKNQSNVAAFRGTCTGWKKTDSGDPSGQQSGK